LIKKGAKIRAYDPVACAKARKILDGVVFSDTAYEAIKDAHAVVVAAEWGEFKELDLYKVKKSMKTPIIFDGRNIYNPKVMKEIGFKYYGMGR
jgi:UDPglucose 6-dehydrogenase